MWTRNGAWTSTEHLNCALFALTSNFNMADGKTDKSLPRQKFGYEETLIYGRYRRDLGNFAKFQAKKLKQLQKEKNLGKSEAVKTRSKRCLYILLDRLIRFRDVIFKAIGEDWVFLALLGIIMAFISFFMDIVVDKCITAKIWLYEEVAFSLPLQYFIWVSYSIILICFSAGFTHLVSPQAAGSGIPEMKTILRGVVLKEFLTFRTLIAKVVGLTAALSAHLTVGKLGPFVHIASIVAALLGKLTSFKGVYFNESRRTEMLAAAFAVGVAATMSAPIGGVLFSVELTGAYFAVRNCWRGFFAALCGAITFRLLAIFFGLSATITAIFKTNLMADYPFDPLELLVFSAVGLICGLGGSAYIWLHRNIILFIRRRKSLNKFLQENRFVYPGVVALVISSLTFPAGVGQYFAAMLTNRQSVIELFHNVTWGNGDQAMNYQDTVIISNWIHPSTNVFVTLALYTGLQFLFGCTCNTLPVPIGVLIPSMMVGAGLGRLVGEAMAAWFPLGLAAGGVVHRIVPAGYAITGAAAFASSVTRTISISIVIFEMSGTISHVLPVIVAVLISYGVSNKLGPSFFDSIIIMKKLPYLPNIVSAKGNAWNIFIEDIMVKDVKYISLVSKYKYLQELLLNTDFRAYPIVDSPESMILLGSVQRYELERIMYVQFHSDRQEIAFDKDIQFDNKLLLASSTRSKGGSSYSSRPTTPLVFIDAQMKKFGGKKSRFHVSKVDSKSEEKLAEEIDKQKYNTIEEEPLRSILKKSESAPKLPVRSDSDADIKSELNTYYRQIAGTKKEGIVEDVPFYISKDNFSSLQSSENGKNKKVNLQAEPVNIDNLTDEKQKELEEEKLEETIDWEGCQIDPSPFQLVERTSLHKVHSLFSLLGLSRAYVTNTGKLRGVCGLQELRKAIQGGIDAQEQIKKEKKKGKEAEQEESDPQELEVVHHPNNNEYVLIHENKTDSEYSVIKMPEDHTADSLDKILPSGSRSASSSV